MQIWMDNCGWAGSHKTPTIEKIIDEFKVLFPNFALSLLPPNMTHLLQVLDLVVNGPIKRLVRAWRAEMIVTNFHKYKAALDIEYAKVDPSTRIFPKY